MSKEKMSRTTYLCENCNHAIPDGAELVAAQTLADVVLAVWLDKGKPRAWDYQLIIDTKMHEALVDYERVKKVAK